MFVHHRSFSFESIVHSFFIVLTLELDMTSSRKNIVKETPKEQEPIEELELADDNDMNYSFSYSSEEEIKEDFEEFGEVREVIQLHCTNWPG